MNGIKGKIYVFDCCYFTFPFSNLHSGFLNGSYIKRDYNNVFNGEKQDVLYEKNEILLISIFVSK